MRRRLLAGMLALAGCQKVEAFVCAGDGECVDGSRSGTCEESGFCSFPDDGCASGKRFGEWAGGGLAGACVEVIACAPACGQCETCEGGACVPVEGGGACEVECGDYVYGLADGNSPPSCLAYASGAGAGTCDGAGACVLATGGCTNPGAEIVGCDLACRRMDHNCEPDTPAAGVTAATMCVTGVETAECASACMDVKNMPSTLLPRQCDADGRCVAEMMTDCGSYRCAGPDACATSCMKSPECVAGAMCMAGMCN